MTTLRGADIVARSLARLGCTPRLHAVGQPHHVDLRCRARGRTSISCTCATRRPRCTWPMPTDGSPASPASRWSPAARATPTRSARCSPRSAPNRRWCCCPATPRPGSSAAAASRSCARPTWRRRSPRRPGPRARRDARPRHRRGDPHRHLRPARPGASQPAVRSARARRRATAPSPGRSRHARACDALAATPPTNPRRPSPPPRGR